MQASSIRILVAEDNPGLAHVMRFNLERAGFDVTVASDGAEALALAREEVFDIVLTDHEMPVLTGVELTARLRQLPEYQTTPVVMVTARELELDIRCLTEQLGLATILPKPYSPEKLLQTVRQLVEQRTVQLPA